MILFPLFFVPLQRIEIANLKPIEAIWINNDMEFVKIETDTGDLGFGKTIEEAVDDLKKNSTGIIYLDTAKFVFADEMSNGELIAFKPFVKRNVRLCIWSGEGSFADAVQYADAHDIGVRYKDWEQGSNLPEIELELREK